MRMHADDTRKCFALSPSAAALSPARRRRAGVQLSCPARGSAGPAAGGSQAPHSPTCVGLAVWILPQYPATLPPHHPPGFQPLPLQLPPPKAHASTPTCQLCHKTPGRRLLSPSLATPPYGMGEVGS
eukprot:753388-Hanusia_phi.AAC.5